MWGRGGGGEATSDLFAPMSLPPRDPHLCAQPHHLLNPDGGSDKQRGGSVFNKREMLEAAPDLWQQPELRQKNKRFLFFWFPFLHTQC